MAKVSDTRRVPEPMDSTEAMVREYKHLKIETDKLAKRQKELRDRLIEVVTDGGYEDDQGHMWLEFDEPLDGVASLQRQRRVARAVNDDNAEEVLVAHGLWDDCTELVRVVNEDRVMEALYDDKLTEDDVDRIYPPKVTYALVLK